MFGKVELPSGADKLDGEIKWNSYYKEVARRSWRTPSEPTAAVLSIEVYGRAGG